LSSSGDRTGSAKEHLDRPKRPFSILDMRSAFDDRTAKAVIRDEALALFARLGPDAVTVRQIAAAAEVSPALVVHHFGSKQGLRAAVDERVAGIFDELFASMAAAPAAVDWSALAADASLAAFVLRELPPDSPIPAYLRRLWLAGDEAGTALFRRWYAASRTMFDALAAAGVLVPAGDPAVRAAFVMVNDLVVLLLRDQLTEVLGVDPLAPDGLRRWLTEAMDVYRDGLFAPPAAS
jgi:TetR/AcrR family transcriptional regulator, regulator of cefoperazone and chloramphenicol sensitivity